MKKSVFTLERARQLTGDVWELALAGDASAIKAPGQFVNLELPGKFLRRPISVCDWTAEGLTLLVKEAGAGTRDLVRLPAGTALDTLSGLGTALTSPPRRKTPSWWAAALAPRRCTAWRGACWRRAGGPW